MKKNEAKENNEGKLLSWLEDLSIHDRCYLRLYIDEKGDIKHKLKDRIEYTGEWPRERGSPHRVRKEEKEYFLKELNHFSPCYNWTRI